MTGGRWMVFLALAIAGSVGCTKADISLPDAGGGSGGDGAPEVGSGGAPGTGGELGEDASDGSSGDDADAAADLVADTGGPELSLPDMGPPDLPPDLSGNADGGGDGTTDGGGYDGPPGIMPSMPGQILVSELLPASAALTDDLGEWVEIYNPSLDITYDLNGCSLMDDAMHSAPITAPLIMQPGTYHTIARSSGGFPPDFIQRLVKFGNDHADAAQIVCGGVTITRFAYQMSDVLDGHSMSVDPSHLKPDEYTLPGNWCHSNVSYYSSGSAMNYGTPNKVNPPCPAGM